MTPERMARLVARWVLLYTADLPPSAARRRAEEIGADLHDQIAHERASGRGDRRIAVSIASRMVRGVSADVAWRARHAEARALDRAIGRAALGPALFLLIPLVAMLSTDDVVWGPGDFVASFALLFGARVAYLLLTRRASALADRAVAALAVASVLFLLWSAAAVGLSAGPAAVFVALFAAAVVLLRRRRAAARDLS